MATDVLIVGGGVIGLSLAYELASEGLSVRVVERGTPGREASWAGAGILPAAKSFPGAGPYEQLVALSHQLHADWAVRLREETGIDNGYLRCGGLYVACDAETEALLRATEVLWRSQNVECQSLSYDELAELEPALRHTPSAAQNSSQIRAAYLIRDEAQLRNPRHLKALVAACRSRGVMISAGMPVEGFEHSAGLVQGARSCGQLITAGVYVVTTGAWSTGIVRPLGVEIAVKPIRGQMALLACQSPILRRVVNDGPRYLVPRADGRVLVGSTEEDAGFDKRNTAEAIGELLRFAIRLAPVLGLAELETTWAGLRPASADGLPYIGRVPGLTNAYVAAGHFRSGLHLSPGTARVLGELIRGREPSIDLAAFRLDRSAANRDPSHARTVAHVAGA